MLQGLKLIDCLKIVLEATTFFEKFLNYEYKRVYLHYLKNATLPNKKKKNLNCSLA